MFRDLKKWTSEIHFSTLKNDRKDYNIVHNFFLKPIFFGLEQKKF